MIQAVLCSTCSLTMCQKNYVLNSAVLYILSILSKCSLMRYYPFTLLCSAQPFLGLLVNCFLLKHKEAYIWEFSKFWCTFEYFAFRIYFPIKKRKI